MVVMHRKRIPLYNCFLEVAVGKTARKVAEEYYGIKDADAYDAMTATTYNKIGQLIIAIILPENPKPSLVAHECVHATNKVFQYVGAVLDLDNDEPQAYLLDWFVDECYRGVKKHKNKKLKDKGAA